ncbi:hypothetical protein [Paracoccus albus]|uniref:hypothetical protein n=1 Tax=Paracoccus albus TaxID=3017784 RepID=UPI0022F0ED94|nr:hypothetical protein [Paracoccus albus]WBU61765.1 hypothetical protein PAF20_07690 [Paracoccus albus]
MIGADAMVAEGVVFTLKVMVNSDLPIERGATVHLEEMVCGDIVNPGGEVLRD